MDLIRKLAIPEESFFLFGPRATGKTTFLTKQLKPHHTIDLLKSKEFLKYSKHPEMLAELIAANPSWKIIVIDEIQKVPQLLDEVHSLIFEKKSQLQFILTGSSARKLKKENANLLAGRALMRKFHPFSANELLETFNLEDALKFGLLPHVWSLKSPDAKNDYLYSYVETYLRVEIQQEALTRNLPAYSSFLEHMALRNSQVMNLQNISKEIGVARSTINGYLEILVDTLLGVTLPPIHLKAKVKEVSNPKFYFFDTGVVRALANELDSSTEHSKGQLLETYILHELMTHSDYNQKRWNFHYWATPSDNEVDFVITSGREAIGIEVKSSKRWDNDFSRGLKTLLDAGKIKKAYGVYRGDEFIMKDKIKIIPATKFASFLENENLF